METGTFSWGSSCCRLCSSIEWANKSSKSFFLSFMEASRAYNRLKRVLGAKYYLCVYVITGFSVSLGVLVFGMYLPVPGQDSGPWLWLSGVWRQPSQ